MREVTRQPRAVADPTLVNDAVREDTFVGLEGMCTMAVSVNLNKGLDKAYEDKTLDEILSAPPSALAGVTDKDAELLKEALGIATVRDLGSNKHFALAGVLVALSGKTG
jgi:hypothetical protein